MKQTIAEFIADLQLIGRSPRTIEEHTLELNRLERWLNEQGLVWNEVNWRQLQSYARTKASLGYSSRANSFTTLRVFYHWAVTQELMSTSPAAHLKTPSKSKPVPRSLSADQLHTLITWLLNQATAGKRQHRDMVLILTGLYSGLRCAELANLHWADIDQAGRVITIRLSKMNHGRSIPLHPALAEQLASWRIHQAGHDDWPVFSIDGQPLSVHRPGKICSRISAESGVPFTTHQLRHSFATWMLRTSGNLYAVSKTLGHSQLQQTEIYLSAQIEDLRVAVDSLPAIEAW